MPPRRKYIPKGNQMAEESSPALSGQDAAVSHQQSSSSSVNCLLCVFPLADVTAIPCAHDGLICATCTVKLTRHLAPPRCCPFCKTEWPDVVFDPIGSVKPYAEYQDAVGLFTIESLAARSSLKEIADKYNKLMICHCVKCDEVGISIDFLTLEKLQGHLKRKHQVQFCMPCAQHRKAFVGDLQLFTEEGTLRLLMPDFWSLIHPLELRKHMKEGALRNESQPAMDPHPVCQFCRVAHFSGDELFTHMEREHYHCHICFRQSNGKKRYERSYKDLEVHFRKRHYICDDPTCLAARFVVFESELGLRGHRLQMHSGNLTQKERRAMGNVQVDLVYRTPGLPPSGVQHARPDPVAYLPLNDPEQFPSTSSNPSTASLAGWVGPRPNYHVPLSNDNFPILHPSASNGLRQGRLPLRPAKATIEPYTDPSAIQQRNSILVATMKSLVQEPSAYKKFKLVSQEYLNGQGTKASEFLACFVQVFGGLDGSTQDVMEGLISLLPDEQKRQALHLVYRHEVDRLRINPPNSPAAPRLPIPPAPTPPQWVRIGPRPNSARVVRRHIVNAPVPVNRSAPVNPVTNSAALTRSSLQRPFSQPVTSNLPPPWVAESAPVYPINPISFGYQPPPVTSQELFPSLISVAAAVPTTHSSEYCWKTLDDSIAPMSSRKIQLPAIVGRRLDFCLVFGRHCLSILKKKFEPEQGIPVTIQSLRRVQNQARNVTVSDLDIEFPLTNLGVHVGCITRLQNLFRNVPDLDYGLVRIRVDRILSDMRPDDLYLLVEYVISLFKSIASQRPVANVKTETQKCDPDNDSGSIRSKKHRQRSKSRTLIQFG